MSTTSAVRPLAVLAASSLLLGTVVMTASALDLPQRSGAGTVVAAVGCQAPADSQVTGRSWGPLFHDAR
jgi:hypothetical protein